MAKRVLVAGGGLGGLSAAIHARLRGFDVAVFEQSVLGGKAARIDVQGFALDPGPSIIILPEIYREVFRLASRNPDDYLRFTRLDPVTRVFQEGMKEWIDIPAGLNECLETAKQISEKDASSLNRICGILKKVEPHIQKSVFQRPIHSALQLLDLDLIAAGRQFAKAGVYKEFIDSNFESPLFRAFFYGFPAYSGQSYSTRSMSGLLIPYYMLCDGVYYPTGGVSAIPKSFERLAHELGVEFRLRSRVTAIEYESWRVTGVRLDSGALEKCDYLISNIDRLTTQSLLGRTVEARPSFSYFTIHWGINRRLVNLAHHSLLIPNGFEKGFETFYQQRSFPEPPIIYLNVTNELDPATAPDGCTNLFAVVGSPACEPQIDWATQTIRSRDLVLKQLKNFGWDINPADIIFERIQTPAYFQEQHGNYLGSLYGPEESERLFGGLFPLKCKDESLRNLFYAGGSVQPGAGLPMVTLSGKFAADLVSRREGK